jgi:branched-chain amino acid transport system permease protein
MKVDGKYSFGFIILAGLFLLFLPFMTPYKALASQMLVFAIFAIGYDIAFGYTGLLSFGHAAFFGLGAYGTGLSLIHLSIPAPLAILIGIMISLLVAFPIGYLSIRRRGIYFAMVTLAFAQMIYFIAFKWRALTGGDDGLHGVPRPPLGTIDLRSELVLYYFILFFFILSIILGIRIIKSPFGKTLECLRENEERARSIGYNPIRYKLISFVISTFFAGLAGGLYALLQNFVPLFCLGLDVSGDVVLMTLIGGMGTLYGPIMGAMALIFLKDLLSTHTNIWPLFLGLLFVISVMTFRKGVFKELRERLINGEKAHTLSVRRKPEN